MFNPSTPNNQLPLLPSNFDYHSKDIYIKTLEAQKALAKLNGLLHLLPNADVLVTPLITAESVSSSAIENINTTTIEVLKAQALPEDFRAWPEKEVLHYREAILYGYELIKQHDYLIINDLIQIQQIIEPNKPWIRSLPGTIIANSKWEAIYKPPQGKDIIISLLSNLEQFINMSDDNIYPLIKTWVIHYQFEAIHPFYDGNGRTGRVLMVLYLMMTKLLDYPVLFLSWYINQNKTWYYQALHHTHQTDDYTQIINYILDAIMVQSNITSNKILWIQELIVVIEIEIVKYIKKDGYKLARLLLQNPFISIQKIADHLNITRQTVSIHINKLAKAELVTITSVWKHKLVSIPAFIQLLSE